MKFTAPVWTLACGLLFLACAGRFDADEPRPGPVKIIFDTDIGNDVYDALALSVVHALQSRQVCELLAVTVTKPHDLAGLTGGCLKQGQLPGHRFAQMTHA